MEPQNKNEQIVLQMNELFDELIEDAYDFSKDMMFGIKMVPFAIGFMFIFAIVYGYVSFMLYPSGLLSNLLDAVVIGVLTYVIYQVTMKYFELKKKYSTLFNLKEKLDNLEEL